jgi:hypothetical protein
VIVEARVLGKPGVVVERACPGLESSPSLGDLLSALVRAEVADYAERHAEQVVCHVLTPAELVTGVAVGRIVSGGRRVPETPSVDDAVDRALQAFRDGLVLAVVDGLQVDDLDDPLVLTGASRLRLVRLVALAGG